MNALPSLLFSNRAAMAVIGFNAHEIEAGFTRRGDWKRKNKPRQGPISPQALAQNLAKLSETNLETFFNQCIRRLSELGLFAPQVLAIVDGSVIETTSRYTGCGLVRKGESRRLRDGSRVTLDKITYGWKAIVLIDAATRLPLAIKVVKIEAYEGEWLVPLWQQAQENLGARAKITKIVADRGYLAGADLYQLQQQGLLWVLRAKSNMSVAHEAIALSVERTPQTRVVEVRHGQGKKQTVARLVTEVVGVPGLKCYRQYAPPKEPGKRRKYAGRNPVNAVVVRTWNNVPQEPRPVFLTNGTVEDALGPFDDYDQRSLIENGIFREGKQAWNLALAPMKTEAAVKMHVIFTLAVMALTTGYRLWEQQPAATEEAAPAPVEFSILQGQGTRAWRRQLIQENLDYVIVFVGPAYGIFHAAEFAILSGIRIKQKGLPSALGSPEDILRRYGILPKA